MQGRNQIGDEATYLQPERQDSIDSDEYVRSGTSGVGAAGSHLVAERSHQDLDRDQ